MRTAIRVIRLVRSVAVLLGDLADWVEEWVLGEEPDEDEESDE